MLTKLYKLLAMATIAALVLAMSVIAPVAAADQPATTREGAGAPLSGVVEIGAGQTHWYMFKYHYDNSKSDNEPATALVVLRMNIPSALSFSVETPGNLALPKEDKDGHLRGPVGVGAPMSLRFLTRDLTEEQIKQDKDMADEHGMLQDWHQLYWAGNARTQETFYVVVKNNRDFACQYKLTITGSTVTFN